MRLSELHQALQAGAKDGGTNLFIEARSQETWRSIRTAPYYSRMREALREAKAELVREPIRVLPYALLIKFLKTGSRKEYEAEYFRRRLRLNTFALLALMENDAEDVRHLEDAIWAICDEFTWSLPAHLPPASIEDGSARVHIDLFAAETGFALSEILFLLEKKLSEAVVRRAKREIRERVTDAYLCGAFDWEHADHNWAAVCAGSIGAAALYTLNDEKGLLPLLHRVLASLECYLSGFEADGVCREGNAYWTYGFGYYVYFAELLRQKTMGRIDLLQGEKIEQIALFQQKTYLTGNHTVSFSDAARRANYQVGLTHRLKQRFPALEVPDEKVQAGYTDDHCYRWAHAVRNLVWSSPDIRGGLRDASYVMDEAQWMVIRRRTERGTLCFAAKGGHNDEPHNHNDLGTFILHADGETLLTDTGQGEYTRQYFGPQRYALIGNSSAGHSVPIVEGGFQKAGRDCEAQVLHAETAGSEAVMTLDITKAYDNPNLKKLTRTFHFKASAARLIITDSYRFQRTPSSVTERFVSFMQPEVRADGNVVLRGEKAVAVLSAGIVEDGTGTDVSIKHEAFVNHAAKTETLYLIDWHIARLQPQMEAVFTIDLDTNG